MKRLILIGNGFDLAHGIKSSFNDFIEWYLAKAYNAFLNIRTKKYSDELLSIQNSSPNTYYTNNELWGITTPERARQRYDDIEQNPQLNIKIEMQTIFKRIKDKSSDVKWVDIEMEFFQLFSEIRDLVKEGRRKSNEIDGLNSQFNYLRSQFLEYLQKQEDVFVNDYNKTALVQCFTEKITREDGLNSFSEEKPNDIHFLNFNYTRTLEPYVEETSKIIPSTINYIHGNLDRSKGEPIFGYGDEMDKKFAEFEHDNDNRLFKHIKSFGYLKNSNYADLLRFIQSDDFQVHIYGHSCGLSDRTMLHEIFEHTRCKSIKIFYYEKDDGTNDFTDKTYEIYRHFNNKELVRKRIVDFSKSSAMPQPRKVTQS